RRGRTGEDTRASRQAPSMAAGDQRPPADEEHAGRRRRGAEGWQEGEEEPSRARRARGKASGGGVAISVAFVGQLQRLDGAICFYAPNIPRIAPSSTTATAPHRRAMHRMASGVSCP